MPSGIVLDLDKGRMQQALMNLIVNGIQAIEHDGQVIIRGFVEAEQGRATIEVMDTGAGIPPDVLPRVFDPFFTTKDVGRGTGLGLSVTYSIVESHHGEISVESEVGRGTEFVLHLPLRGKG